MNAKMGKPQGTDGTITFDGSVGTKAAVRAEDGRFFVQSVNPNLWLPANIRSDQFRAA